MRKDEIAGGPSLQVAVGNVVWGPALSRRSGEAASEKADLPSRATLDFTGARYDRLMSLKGQEFEDEVERMAYEVLSYRYGHEVWRASIWISSEG